MCSKRFGNALVSRRSQADRGIRRLNSLPSLKHSDAYYQECRTQRTSLGAAWRGPSTITPDKSTLQIMSPTRDLIHVSTFIEMMKSRIGIGLQSAFEVLQMQSRMFTLAIRRVSEPHGWRRCFACSPFIADISPEASGLGLPVSRSEHRNRCIVGMNLACG